MSLDVYLVLGSPVQRQGSGIFVRENGSNREISRAEWDEKFPGREPVVVEADPDDRTVFSANITSNLVRMAAQADLYTCLWRPDEHGIERADQLIELLEAGLKRLRDDPEQFRFYNPESGWGTYEGLVEFVEQYLAACRANPAAVIQVSR